MKTNFFKRIGNWQEKRVTVFSLAFFLCLSVVCFCLFGCGGGGGGGSGFVSGGGINPALFSGWEMTNGPFSGMVYSLAVDPNNRQRVYAAVGIGGLFTSADGGRSWTHIEGDLTNASISAVDVHVDGLTIYVGTGSDGVYQSLGGGKDWTQVSNGLPVDGNTNKFYEIFGITIDPTDADTVYALSGDRWYLCRTTDGGASWTRIDGGARPQGGLPWDKIEEFVIHPDDSQWLYVGTDASGVYKSEDMGDSWIAINGDPGNGGLPAYVVNIPSLAVDGTNNILFAGSRDYGLWWTGDDGQTWVPMPVGGLTGWWDVYALEMDPANKSVIYAYVENVRPDEPQQFDPTEDGIYRTFDGGNAWEKVPFHEYPNTYRPVREIAIAPSNGNVVYVTTEGEGVYMTTDITNVASVDDWQSIDNGLVDIQVLAMVMQPWDNKIVYAGTEQGLYKTINGGLQWERKGLRDKAVFALVIDPNDSNIIYVATANGVYKTENGGNSWYDPADSRAYYCLALGKDFQNRNIIYGGSAFGNGIYKALDDGSVSWGEISWQEKNNGLSDDEKYVSSLALDSSDPSSLYAGIIGKVIKTQDGGDTWERMVDGLPLDKAVCSLSMDPYNPRILYAGTRVGFYATSDGGDTWVFKDGGLGQRYVRFIAINPMDSKNVCAGTYYDGVFATIDGGENWTQLNKGLLSDLNKRICSLVMDISNINNPVIYAGTGCGVFKAYK